MGYEAVVIGSYQCFRELAAGTCRAYLILVAYIQKVETASSEMAVSIFGVHVPEDVNFVVMLC